VHVGVNEAVFYEADYGAECSLTDADILRSQYVNQACLKAFNPTSLEPNDSENNQIGT